MISAKVSLDVPHSTSCVTHVEWVIWTQVHAFASTDPQAHPLRPRTTSMQLINIDNKWFETQLNIIQITLRVGKTDVLVPKKFHAECLVIFVKIFHLLSDLHDHVKFGNDMWRRILKSNNEWILLRGSPNFKQHFFLLHIDLYWSHWFTRHLVKKYKLLWVLYNIVILCCSWIALVFY